MTVRRTRLARIAPNVSVTRDHGVPLGSELAPLVVATIHPSAVLRASGGPARDALPSRTPARYRSQAVCTGTVSSTT